MVGRIVLFLALAGLLSSAVYLLLALIAGLRFRFTLPETPPSCDGGVVLPPVAILKPLHGMEPLLEENLESFFRQDYPSFELIFGARNSSDPALQVVETLQQKHPGIKTRIILSGEPAYPNAKVYALERMVAAASFPYLVITDSDVHVASDFIRQVVPPLLDSSVGLVTCIYRGVPTGGLWSRLEALGMSVELTSGVLVAEFLEGMRFALGPGMATRKEVLASLGGIEALGAYCSDDFVLGQLTYATGKKVVLSRHVIDHVALHRSARASWLHQLRWMKSTRFSRPLGHVGTVMTFAMPFGLLGMAACIAMGSWRLGFGLLSLAVLNRVVQSIAVGWGVLRDSRSLWFCWLYPARDLLGFFLWCASFFGTKIVWRGEHYKLEAGGKMTRKSGPLSSAPKPSDSGTQHSSSRSVTLNHRP
ncbi:MAG: bacteriohopanetetrol glucosamine biosynthesis glycosyltransferase HpnI [Acidobacteriia bacterium]|nr:bacteriohopanetetrol glucosamine biosynthesis glycosyltransferase HpnI [Terriglobia bacterium]